MPLKIPGAAVVELAEVVQAILAMVLPKALVEPPMVLVPVESPFS